VIDATASVDSRGTPGRPAPPSSEPVTDWRLAVDEYGRPIPPPPSTPPPSTPPPSGPSATVWTAYQASSSYGSPPPPQSAAAVVPTPMPVPAPTPVPLSHPLAYGYSQPATAHYSAGTLPTASEPQVWLPGVMSVDAVTPQVVTVEASSVVGTSPYAALPAVSLSTGVVPASVPVPTGNTGVGLTALDEAPIDVAGPPSLYPALYTPHPAPSPMGSQTGWDVVVDGVGSGQRGHPAATSRPFADLLVTSGPTDLRDQSAVSMASAAADPAATSDKAAADAVVITGDPGVAHGDGVWGAPVVTVGPAATTGVLSAPLAGRDAAVPPLAALPSLLAELAATAAATAEAMGAAGDAARGMSVGPATGPAPLPGSGWVAPAVSLGSGARPRPAIHEGGWEAQATTRTGEALLDGRLPGVTGTSAWPADGVGAERPGSRWPLARPAVGEERGSRADLATRYAVVREQVDYALAEIALARAAFRRASEEDGPGWPFRDNELDILRRPAVAHALACELTAVERLRVWAQELHWLQEQRHGVKQVRSGLTSP